jgi:Domain of unknown function (DUF4440)
MKKQFVLVYATLIAVAPFCFSQTSPVKPAKPASNEAAITDLEKSAWDAYKNKQPDAFKALLSNDYRGAYAEGIKSADGEIVEATATNFRDYSLGDVKILFPSADVAVITYIVTQQATSAGKDISGTYNSWSVWIKRAGKWLCISHTGVKGP